MPAKLPLALITALLAALAATSGAATAPAQTTSLTVYSGRDQALVKPVLDRFTKDTGIALNVRYASSTRSPRHWSKRGAIAPPTSTGRRSRERSVSSPPAGS